MVQLPRQMALPGHGSWRSSASLQRNFGNAANILGCPSNAVVGELGRDLDLSCQQMPGQALGIPHQHLLASCKNIGQIQVQC